MPPSEGGGSGCKSPREHHPFPNVDHDVTVASRPVKAAVRVQVPLINPTFQSAHMMKRRVTGLQNRFTRCESGVRVHHFS